MLSNGYHQTRYGIPVVQKVLSFACKIPRGVQRWCTDLYFAMPKNKKKNQDRHKNSAVITIRLKNSEIEAIDEIVKFSEFRSRNECVRYLLQPALVKFITAINTKSAWKASVAQISAEIDLNKRLKLARVNSNKNAQIEIPGIDDLEVVTA